jgi:hypothetical protein
MTEQKQIRGKCNRRAEQDGERMLTVNGEKAEEEYLSVPPSVASPPPNDPVWRPAEPVVDLAAASPSSPADSAGSGSPLRPS